MGMSSETLFNYLEYPERLNSSSTKTISNLIEKYPFFQTARLLQIKNLQNIHHTVDRPTLNLTATYVTDRRVLYYLLHRPDEKEDNKSVSPAHESRVISPEKDFKDTMQENIAATLNKQVHYYEFEPEHEIELIPGLAIDLRKEYGDGIELNEKSYSIGLRRTENKNEMLELTDEDENSFSPDIDSEVADNEVTSEKSNNPTRATESVEEEISEISNSPSPFEIIEEQISEGTFSGGAKSKIDTTNNKPSESIIEWLSSVEKYKVTDNESSHDVSEISESLEFVDDSDVILFDEQAKPNDLAEKLILPEPQKEKEKIQQKKEKDGALIDRFIKASPRISPVKLDEEIEDISADSVKEHESFFTDTLAQIYVKQGNYAKAILAYEKLSLKYPEKSSYFAGQILEIKKLISKS